MTDHRSYCHRSAKPSKIRPPIIVLPTYRIFPLSLSLLSVIFPPKSVKRSSKKRKKKKKNHDSSLYIFWLRTTFDIRGVSADVSRKITMEEREKGMKITRDTFFRASFSSYRSVLHTWIFLKYSRKEEEEEKNLAVFFLPSTVNYEFHVATKFVKAREAFSKFGRERGGPGRGKLLISRCNNIDV